MMVSLSSLTRRSGQVRVAIKVAAAARRASVIIVNSNGDVEKVVLFPCRNAGALEFPKTSRMTINEKNIKNEKFYATILEFATES
ncbi:hypothetical protein L6R21_12565 [bacterium]|nr:hypothetical protein [bacterium]